MNATCDKMNGADESLYLSPAPHHSRLLTKGQPMATGHSIGILPSSPRRERHGMTESSTYRVWCHIKWRCFSQNCPAYKYYGGRGITMCERWRNSFVAFLNDMGEKPDGLSIDRYPNQDGNYEPGNCRWATTHEQAVNRRPRSMNANPGLRNEPRPLNNATIKCRLDRGWDESEAVSVPALSFQESGMRSGLKRRKLHATLEVDGVFKCLTEWAEEYGVGTTFLRSRMKRGMTLKEALMTPKMDKFEISRAAAELRTKNAKERRREL